MLGLRIWTVPLKERTHPIQERAEGHSPLGKAFLADTKPVDCKRRFENHLLNKAARRK